MSNQRFLTMKVLDWVDQQHYLVSSVSPYTLLCGLSYLILEGSASLHPLQVELPIHMAKDSLFQVLDLVPAHVQV